MASRRAFRIDHPIVLTFLILAIIAFLYLAAEVLKPLALAVLLTFALVPFARFFERRGLPRGPAVMLTILGALTVLGGVGYVVGQQLSDLARDLPEKQGKIEQRLAFLRPRSDSTVKNLTNLAENVSETLEAPLPTAVDAAAQQAKAKAATPPAEISPTAAGPTAARPRPSGAELTEPVKVEVVQRPSFQERLQTAVGPYLEFLAVALFVLILALFMLLNREDLGDRVLKLFGRRQLSHTTRTMEEVGRRISRYLAIFATVNSSYGLVVGVGLALIGVPHPVLWGFLAAALRFVPYVGPAVAIVLPTVYSLADSPTWHEPAMVLGFFAVLELVATYGLEPIVYGKTTGVSALGLLVAAMFWTWLWGALGLLLSTPLTVCLAVLGKYVPSLGAFATLLGEEAELDPDVRLYQRLLAADQDGANEVIEEELRKRPRAELFDQVFIPALSRAERDHAREEIDDGERALIWRVVGEALDELEGTEELSLEALAAAGDNGQAEPGRPAHLVAVAANDTADVLALRMLGQLLAPAGLSLEVVTDTAQPLKLADDVAERAPGLVLLSHLPPVGLTAARYLVRRLHARLPELPVVVGRWGDGGDLDGVAEKLTAMGASKVLFSLADARDHLLDVVRPRAPVAEALAPVPT